MPHPSTTNQDSPTSRERPTSHDGHVAKLMDLAMFALSNSVDDVRLGRYGSRERRQLAAGLDQLSAALREEDRPVVIETSGDA